MITRAQIRRQLRQNGGIMNAIPRQRYGLGDFVRKLIPKEIAKVSTVAAPFVAPFNPALAAGMAGLGSFQQTGRIGPSVGRGLAMYGLGQGARYLGGAGPQWGLKAPGAGTGFKSYFSSPLSAGRSASLFGTPGSPGSRVGEAVSKYVPGTRGVLSKMGLTEGFGKKMPTPFGMISGASLLTYFMQKGATEEEAEELAQDVYRGKGLGMDQIRADMKKYRSGILSGSQAHDMGYHFLTPRNYLGAQGGRVELKKGTKGKGPHGKTDKEVLKELYPTLFSDTTTSIEGSPKKKKYTKGRAQGGRIGYQGGSDDPRDFYTALQEEEGPGAYHEQEILEEFGHPLIQIVIPRTQKTKKAQGGRIGKFGGGIGVGMPRIPMGMPRVNAGGVSELDYRQEGGFVPVGVKEKADDVPAMLSKNEFVMTADAVKGAGGGNVEKGAQRMYDTMKSLEKRIA